MTDASPSASELVTLDTSRSGVAVVTLNRPERLNALSFGMITALIDTLHAVAADPKVHVGVLTGAGRGFCAGLDLKEHGSSPRSAGLSGPAAAMRGQAYFASMLTTIRSVPQPFIAAINGVTVGGGFAISLGCDIRVAVTSATFNVQALKIGLSAGESGMTFMLPRLVGASAAAELMLTSRTFDAAEAERIGLVSRVVADGDALNTALEIADQIASYDPVATAHAKRIMWTNLTAANLDAALAVEALEPAVH